MKKEELIATCKRLQSENDRLQDELDRLSDCYTEMENKHADAVNALDSTNVINDLDDFMFRLEVDGLLTSQLKDFIEIYLKYYNERK